MTVQTGSSIVVVVKVDPCLPSPRCWPGSCEAITLVTPTLSENSGSSHSTARFSWTLQYVLYICYYFQWAVGAWREFRLIPLHSTVLLDIMYSIYCMLLISMISRGMEGYGTSVRFSKTVTLLPIRYIFLKFITNMSASLAGGSGKLQ